MITIEDRIMGSGKTTRAIDWMNSNNNYMFITPFLSEVDRVVDKVNNVFEPNTKNDNGSKLDSLLKLAKRGSNIVSTHSCFQSLTKKDFHIFKDYTLILDEVVNPIEVLKISKDDIKMMLDTNKIQILEDKTVIFLEKNYDGTFTYFRDLCRTSNVIYVNDSFLIWCFPVEIFTSFKNIKILTYLFEGSLLSAYFKYFNIEYMVDSQDDSDVRLKVKNLLNIYNGDCNLLGKASNSLSKRCFEKRLTSEQLKSIRNTTNYMFTKVFKTKSEDNAYTTFLDYVDKVKGGGYSKGFIPVNARATNDYATKKSMAYLANRYVVPSVDNFFKEKNINMNEDLWALSELLQWIWRGCIRNGEPMNLYIPNKRMRGLLIKWLNN
jgi:hypothetical protein